MAYWQGGKTRLGFCKCGFNVDERAALQHPPLSCSCITSAAGEEAAASSSRRRNNRSCRGAHMLMTQICGLTCNEEEEEVGGGGGG